MIAQRIIGNAFVLGTLALFVLALMPGVARGFQPQPEAPGKQLSTPQGVPKMTEPLDKPPAVQPPAGHTGPRLPAPPGPAPGAVLPHFKTKTAPLAPGKAKGFDVFTPSESGKFLPGAPKMAEPTFASPGETKATQPLDMPAPGNAGEKGIIVDDMPAPGETKGIIDDGKLAPGKTKGIIEDNIPAPEAAQAAK